MGEIIKFPKPVASINESAAIPINLRFIKTHSPFFRVKGACSVRYQRCLTLERRLLLSCAADMGMHFAITIKLAV